MPHEITRWGDFGAENWPVALGTSCLLITRVSAVFQQPMQKFKVNECVTPFEKDPPSVKRRLKPPAGEVTSTFTEGMEKLVSARLVFFLKENATGE